MTLNNMYKFTLAPRFRSSSTAIKDCRNMAKMSLEVKLLRCGAMRCGLEIFRKKPSKDSGL